MCPPTTQPTFDNIGTVFAGDDLNTDDVIYFDDRPARVVRVGLWKTILFIYEVGCVDGKPFIKGGNKVAIQNDKLKDCLLYTSPSPRD